MKLAIAIAAILMPSIALAEPLEPRVDHPELARITSPGGAIHANCGTTTTTVTDTGGKAACFAFGDVVRATAFAKASVCFSMGRATTLGSQADGQTAHTTLTDTGFAASGGHCMGETIPTGGSSDFRLDPNMIIGRPGYRTSYCDRGIKTPDGSTRFPACDPSKTYDCATNGSGGACKTIPSFAFILSSMCVHAQCAATVAASDVQLSVQK